MHIYRSPGLEDEDLDPRVYDAWNAQIKAELDRHETGRFLKADPAQVDDPRVVNSVNWPGHPLEALDCVGETLASRLSDWGWRGRTNLHNEYLEYTLLLRSDSAGNLRPKRFIATTELMEWWRTMAIYDLPGFLRKVEEVTGESLTATALFGVDEATWATLNVGSREGHFADALLDRPDIPARHALNRDHALFMSHPINGLDDLIFVVAFGARPYIVRESAGQRRASMEEIFAFARRPDLFCRNADPGAARGAYDQVYIEGTNPPAGHVIALANPLGMYMSSFAHNTLNHQGTPVPDDWVRTSRSREEGVWQRLEFGPSDDEDVFLDEITVGVGGEAVTGFDLANLIEVGPLVAVGAAQNPIAEGEFVGINPVTTGTIQCGEGTGRCDSIEQFAREYEQAQNFTRGQRGGGDG